MSAVESSKDLTKDQIALEGIGNDYKYGFSDKEDYIFKSGRGLTE
jgi:hypothetical protein